MNEKGFTLVEIMVACLVLALVLASIYVIYLTGIVYFARGCRECDIQSRARRALERLVIGWGRQPGDIMVVDGIRFGEMVEVFDDINDGTPNPPSADGDYIKVHFPVAAQLDPQGYYFDDGKIMTTMGTPGTGDDVLIIDEVVKMPGVDVFSVDTSSRVSINFRVGDDFDGEISQGIDISTQFYTRN